MLDVDQQFVAEVARGVGRLFRLSHPPKVWTHDFCSGSGNKSLVLELDSSKAGCPTVADAQ
jgi:hypothetical protein